MNRLFKTTNGKNLLSTDLSGTIAYFMHPLSFQRLTSLSIFLSMHFLRLRNCVTVILFGNKKISVMKIIFAISFFCCCTFLTEAQPQKLSSRKNDLLKSPAFTYKLLLDSNKTWGYDIFSDNKLTIHQPHVPGVSGNAGFKTKAAAESVAKLVVSKMKKGEMPPTITIDEMKKLKAI